MPLPRMDHAPGRRRTGKSLRSGIVTISIAVTYAGGCTSPWLHSPGVRLSEIPPAAWSRVAARATEFPAELAEGVWLRVSGKKPGEMQEGSPAYRWRHPGLEALATLPADKQPRLGVALYAQDPVVASNAAIALAREGNETAARRLPDIIADRSLAIEQRLAACETLGQAPHAWVAARLADLLADQDAQARDDAATYIAQLHAELLRAAAPHARQFDRDYLLGALESRHAEVRRAAAQTIRDWGGASPEEMAPLVVADPDHHVRAAAVLALARQVGAIELMQAALQDQHLVVRLAAVEALGAHGGAEAVAFLERAMENAPDRTRGSIARALTAAGETDRVLALAGDEAWEVRLAVAEALGQAPITEKPTRRAGNVAGELFTDRSAQVQWATVHALAHWPLDVAGPLLLVSLEKSGYRIRKAAAEQLAARWEPAQGFRGGRFPVDASTEVRGEALIRLQREWDSAFGVLDRRALAAGTATGSHSVSEEQVRQAAELVDTFNTAPSDHTRRKAFEALVNFGPELTEVLSDVRRRGTPLPEAVYTHILPLRDPLFEAIHRLTSVDLTERRRAAGRLVALSGEGTWPRLAIARMSEVVLTEPDPQVWRSVLTAIATQPGRESDLICYSAIGHTSADVRRRACELLTAHPEAQHQVVLLPALSDEQPEVAAAAARALARQGALSDPRPLERLLGSRDPTARLEAAAALARHGHDSGRAALARMAHDPDPAVRRRVAELAGELGEASLVDVLISLLDDRQSVRLAALDALPRVVGGDPTAQPGATPSTLERIARWKDWRQSASGRVTGF